MIGNPRALMVSDRGPVTFTDPGRLMPVRRAGSVTELVAAACRDCAGTFAWLATSTNDLDRAALADGLFASASQPLGADFEPVLFEKAQYRAYYDDASVQLLWFAHNDLWDEVGGGPAARAADAFRTSFRAVNERFAAEIVRSVPDSVPVIFHDYQFSLCPRMLRKADPGRAHRAVQPHRLRQPRIPAALAWRYSPEPAGWPPRRGPARFPGGAVGAAFPGLLRGPASRRGGLRARRRPLRWSHDLGPGLSGGGGRDGPSPDRG